MIYDFLAYVFIPLASGWFAGATDWMTTNFSILRNSGEKEILFLTWGAILLFCFSLWFRDISRRLDHTRTALCLTRAACLILILAMLTPYLPERFPFWSRIHFYCAFLSPVLFLIGLLFLLLRYRQENPRVAKRYLWGFWIISGLSLILLWKAGMVTSALEIFFASSCSILLRRLHRRVAGCP